jgi:hypothetical protein
VAFHPVRGRVVMVADDSTNPLLRTWEWSGVAWTSVATNTIPPQGCLQMAYDQARQQLVLFAGPLANGGMATWTWNGTTWNQQLPAVSPPDRRSWGMTYDEHRQRVVLFGGETPSSSPPWVMLADTWEWDGAAWTRQNTPAAPQGRLYHHMTYDTAARRVLMVGGARHLHNGGMYGLADVWRLDTAPSASVTTVGGGCGGAGGAPVLTATAAFPGARAFFLELQAARRLANAVIAGDVALAPRTAGGCTWFLPMPGLVGFVVTDGRGSASLRTQVPNDPRLRGLALHAQALVVDPAAPLGVSLSAAVTVVVGS